MTHSNVRCSFVTNDIFLSITSSFLGHPCLTQTLVVFLPSQAVALPHRHLHQSGSTPPAFS